MKSSSPKVAIIGAGCAGISAHIWLCELHISHTLFEGKKMGGMLHRVHNRIENYPPEHYENGKVLAEKLCNYVTRRVIRKGDKADIFIEEDIVSIEKSAEEKGFTLRSHTGQRRFFSHVLLATGTRYRQLDIEGYAQSASFISQSTTFTAPSVAGEKVLIVGGGDAALEGARILLEHSCDVVLCSRSKYRARPEFVKQITKSDSARMLDIGIQVVRFQPEADVLRVVFSDGKSESFKKVFVRIGVDPVVPELFGEMKKDMRGYLRTDSNCETSIPGIFAIGDVSVAPLQSIATAIGDGGRAAKAIQILTQL